MKKLKHEAESFKAALLVHDKVIAPMPEDQVSENTLRHRLATWYAHRLPDGHPLLGS
jgi:hypothetical protein